jgi:hypothetical protein
MRNEETGEQKLLSAPVDDVVANVPRIFDQTISREAGNKPLEITLVVGLDVLIDRVANQRGVLAG